VGADVPAEHSGAGPVVPVVRLMPAWPSAWPRQPRRTRSKRAGGARVGRMV